MKRRDFLKTGIAASSASGIATQIPSAAQRPLAGAPGNKLVGCYLEVDEILGKPEYVDALKDELGVNVVISSPEIKVPEWLRRMNPIGDGPQMHVRAGLTDDDTRARRAIEEIQRRGMQFWLFYHGQHYEEEQARSVSAETFDGIKYIDLPRPAYSREYYKTVCFAKPAVREYSPAVFTYTAQEYAPDVMYVSHYRYANPSFWTNLLGCACSDCQREAVELDYDFPRMKDAVTQIPERIRHLGAGTFRHWATVRPTVTDFLMTLGGDAGGVLSWFAFRAAVVGRSMKRLHDAVHSATDDRCGFVSDTHSATLAMLVGHNWGDFINGANDAIMPLSWLAIHYVATVASWAKQLCTLVEGLDEPTALAFVLRLLCWDDTGLPTERIDDLRIAADGGSRPYMYGRPDSRQGWEVFYEMMNPGITRKIMAHEYTRLAALSHGSIPAYPVVQGREWPRELCEELIGKIGTLGFPGYVFRFTDVFVDKSRF